MHQAVKAELTRRRYWVFDLDGTLTQPVHDFEHIRAELGLPSGSDILSSLAGLPAPQAQRQFQRLDELELHYAAQTRPAAAVLELLGLLVQRDCRLGILTRNSRVVALRSLAAIGALEFFDPADVLGRDEARPKPDPDGIAQLLQRWHALPQQAVMVGDFRYDLEAGRACGTATVHLAHDPHKSWPDLTDLQVSSLHQLHQLLI